jgi:hypothetical protein
MRKDLALALILMLFSIIGYTQEDIIDRKFPEFLDGKVRAIAVDEENSRIYIGGDFSQPLESGENFKSFYEGVNISTGVSSDPFPETNDTLFNIVSDGSGGHFLCGKFTRVDNFSKKSLAHVDSNRQVTALSVDINGPVHDVLPDEENKILYIGGAFTVVNGEKRNNLCAIDLTTYDLLNWDPNVNGKVYDLEQLGDSVFIGGRFSGIGKRSKSIVYNKMTSEIVDNIETNGVINSVIPDGQGGVFIGGKFSEVNGSFRRSIAQIDASGNLTDFSVAFSSFQGSFQLLVNSLVLKEGNLYFGGYFDFVNSQPRENAAAVDAESGAILPWNPNPETWPVHKLEVFRDSILIAGGFPNIDNSFDDRFLALVDKTDGNRSLTFDYPWEDNNFFVFDFAVNDPFIHVAGGFPNSNNVTNTCITFNVDSKEVLPISESTTLNGNINALALKGDTLFIGGSFDQEAQTLGVRSLAALNWQTGELYNWTPILQQAVGGRGVDELKILDDKLYVGGNFFRAEGKPRQLVAAFNTATLEVDEESFGFSLVGNDRTSCVFLDDIYGNLYISATALASAENRYNFAGISKAGEILDISHSFSSGNQLSDFETSAVYDLEVIGDIAFLAGDYSTGDVLDGSSNLTAVNLSNGNLVELDFEPNDAVRTLERDENKLYFGGDFTQVEGMAKDKVGRIDLSSNQVDAWQINLTGESVHTIHITAEDLFIGGSFSEVKGEERSNIASLVKTDFSVNPLTANTNDEVYSLLVIDDNLLAGGAFSRIGIASQINMGSNLTVLDKSTGEIVQIESFPNGAVNEIVIDDDKIFLAGSFNQIGDSPRPGIAALDRDLLTVSNWGDNLPPTTNLPSKILNWMVTGYTLLQEIFKPILAPWIEIQVACWIGPQTNTVWVELPTDSIPSSRLIRVCSLVDSFLWLLPAVDLSFRASLK